MNEDAYNFGFEMGNDEPRKIESQVKNALIDFGRNQMLEEIEKKLPFDLGKDDPGTIDFKRGWNDYREEVLKLIKELKNEKAD